MIFHLREGLHFERQPNGDIRIYHEVPVIHDGHRIGAKVSFDLTVPTNEFASVMASMSARGEDHATWKEAEDYLRKE